MRRAAALSLLLAALLAVRASPARAQASGPIYIVQPGDSLSYIAATFGVSLDDLLAANGITTDHILQPDEQLVIPGFPGVSGILASATVEFGENLATLSLRFGLSQDSLSRLNHVVNPDRIFAGQSLIITDPAPGTTGPVRYPNGKSISLGSGMPLTALAAAEGVNPWGLRTVNALSSPAIQFTGQTVVVPGGEQALRAWPAPLTDVRFRTMPLVQGTTEEVYITLGAEAPAEGKLGDWTLHFRKLGPDMAALQGLPALATPGMVPFSVTVTLPSGDTASFQQDVPLVSGDYAIDPPLTVPPETLDPVTIQAETDQVSQIVAPFTEDRLWEGLFGLPNDLPISSPYGSRRSYNGGVYTSFHTGVDFYAREKQPILAPAAGKVVFAGPLVICGNATIIDHGWGVYTRYCHQNTIEVAVGDTVTAGQEIGLAGHTGRADGPHLHWEVWVGGVQVNPIPWTVETYP